MKARQIALALAVAFPLAAVTACDSQSEAQPLSRATSEPEPPSYAREQADANLQKSTPSALQEPSTLALLDTNADGMVSRSEAMRSSEIEQRFSELDKDNDGKLSTVELEELSTGAKGGS